MIIDYYKELEIPKTASLDEIHDRLARLQNLWRNRESSGHEKARKMIDLLNEAENIFKTDASRTKYDRELDAAGAKPKTADPNAERKANFDKWFAEANNYLNTQQYDLAKSAIDKALQYRTLNDDDALVYIQAAEIYRLNNDYRSALNYINEAIVLDKDNSWSYLTKYLIFEALDDGYNSDRHNFTIEKRKPLLEIALRNAKIKNDTITIGTTLGFFAHAWYFCNGQDVQKAVEYAHEALKYNSGDFNAKNVLDHIKMVQLQEEAYLKQQRENEEAILKQQREAEAAQLQQQRANEEAQLKYQREQQRLASERERLNLILKGISRRNRITHVIAWICAVGSVVYSVYRLYLADHGVPYGGIGYLTVIAIGFLCCAVAVDIGDEFDRGFINPISLGSWIWGFIHAFLATTMSYSELGGNPSAYSAQQGVFFNYIVAVIVAVVISYISYRIIKYINNKQYR